MGKTVDNVDFEKELYEPMRKWLEAYIIDNYKNHEVLALDTHSIKLDKALNNIGIKVDLAVGLDIQIDVLGIAKKGKSVKLFFIEAKKTELTLKDLGQLWVYCKLINPEEAFLITSATIGSLDKVLNIFKREDLLDFGRGKAIKKMKIATWNLTANMPDLLNMIPKI